MNPEVVVIVSIALAVSIFWIIQLVDLMSRRDDEFPGRFDKPTWAFILVVASAVGAVAFAVWKPARRCKPSLDTLLPEPEIAEPIECMECGKTIPSDTSKCPSCGWTYRADLR